VDWNVLCSGNPQHLPFPSDFHVSLSYGETQRTVVRLPSLFNYDFSGFAALASSDMDCPVLLFFPPF
jgi:hypothetical protein